MVERDYHAPRVLKTIQVLNFFNLPSIDERKGTHVTNQNYNCYLLALAWTSNIYEGQVACFRAECKECPVLTEQADLLSALQRCQESAKK